MGGKRGHVTEILHILVELLRVQDLIQPLVKRMARSHRQCRHRRPQTFLPDPLPSSSHRHDLKTINNSPEVTLSMAFHHALLGG